MLHPTPYPEDTPPIPPAQPLAFLKEPNSEVLLALGLKEEEEYTAVTGAFQQALRLLEGPAPIPEGLQPPLEKYAQNLRALSTTYPWHALAEAASFAALSADYTRGACNEVLEKGEAFGGAWPQGAYAPEVRLYMARCLRQQGRFGEYAQLLKALIQQYPLAPAGLKARVAAGLLHSELHNPTVGD